MVIIDEEEEDPNKKIFETLVKFDSAAEAEDTEEGNEAKANADEEDMEVPELKGIASPLDDASLENKTEKNVQMEMGIKPNGETQNNDRGDKDGNDVSLQSYSFMSFREPYKS